MGATSQRNRIMSNDAERDGRSPGPARGGRVAGRTWIGAVGERIGSHRDGSGGRHRGRQQQPVDGVGAAVAGGDQTPPRKANLRRLLIASLALSLMFTGAALVAGTYFVDSVVTAEQLPLPESTTMYYSDGRTVMARL